MASAPSPAIPHYASVISSARAPNSGLTCNASTTCVSPRGRWGRGSRHCVPFSSGRAGNSARPPTRPHAFENKSEAALKKGETSQRFIDESHGVPYRGFSGHWRGGRAGKRKPARGLSAWVGGGEEPT